MKILIAVACVCVIAFTANYFYRQYQTDAAIAKRENAEAQIMINAAKAQYDAELKECEKGFATGLPTEWFVAKCISKFPELRKSAYCSVREQIANEQYAGHSYRWRLPDHHGWRCILRR
jgi:hypothetical protein